MPSPAERPDRGYEAFAECRKNIDRPPSEYLREFYFDALNFDRNATELALKFTGADHLLAGSDYPHQIGSLRKMVDSLSVWDHLSPDDQEKICGGYGLRKGYADFERDQPEPPAFSRAIPVGPELPSPGWFSDRSPNISRNLVRTRSAISD